MHSSELNSIPSLVYIHDHRPSHICASLHAGTKNSLIKPCFRTGIGLSMPRLPMRTSELHRITSGPCQDAQAARTPSRCCATSLPRSITSARRQYELTNSRPNLCAPKCHTEQDGSAAHQKARLVTRHPEHQPKLQVP